MQSFECSHNTHNTFWASLELIDHFQPYNNREVSYNHSRKSFLAPKSRILLKEIKGCDISRDTKFLSVLGGDTVTFDP